MGKWLAIGKVQTGGQAIRNPIKKWKDLNVIYIEKQNKDWVIIRVRKGKNINRGNKIDNSLRELIDLNSHERIKIIDIKTDEYVRGYKIGEKIVGNFMIYAISDDGHTWRLANQKTIKDPSDDVEVSPFKKDALTESFEPKEIKMPTPQISKTKARKPTSKTIQEKEKTSKTTKKKIVKKPSSPPPASRSHHKEQMGPGAGSGNTQLFTSRVQSMKRALKKGKLPKRWKPSMIEAATKFVNKQMLANPKSYKRLNMILKAFGVEISKDFNAKQYFGELFNETIPSNGKIILQLDNKKEADFLYNWLITTLGWNSEERKKEAPSLSVKKEGQTLMIEWENTNDLAYIFKKFDGQLGYYAGSLVFLGMLKNAMKNSSQHTTSQIPSLAEVPHIIQGEIASQMTPGEITIPNLDHQSTQPQLSPPPTDTISNTPQPTGNLSVKAEVLSRIKNGIGPDYPVSFYDGANSAEPLTSYFNEENTIDLLDINHRGNGRIVEVTGDNKVIGMLGVIRYNYFDSAGNNRNSKEYLALFIAKKNGKPILSSSEVVKKEETIKENYKVLPLLELPPKNKMKHFLLMSGTGDDTKILEGKITRDVNNNINLTGSDLSNTSKSLISINFSAKYKPLLGEEQDKTQDYHLYLFATEPNAAIDGKNDSYPPEQAIAGRVDGQPIWKVLAVVVNDEGDVVGTKTVDNLGVRWETVNSQEYVVLYSYDQTQSKWIKSFRYNSAKTEWEKWQNGGWQQISDKDKISVEVDYHKGATIFRKDNFTAKATISLAQAQKT